MFGPRGGLGSTSVLAPSAETRLATHFDCLVAMGPWRRREYRPFRSDVLHVNDVSQVRPAAVTVESGVTVAVSMRGHAVNK